MGCDVDPQGPLSPDLACWMTRCLKGAHDFSSFAQCHREVTALCTNAGFSCGCSAARPPQMVLFLCFLFTYFSFDQIATLCRATGGYDSAAHLARRTYERCEVGAEPAHFARSLLSACDRRRQRRGARRGVL